MTLLSVDNPAFLDDLERAVRLRRNYSLLSVLACFVVLLAAVIFVTISRTIWSVAIPSASPSKFKRAADHGCYSSLASGAA